MGGGGKTYGSTGYQDVQKLCSTIRKGKTMNTRKYKCEDCKRTWKTLDGYMCHKCQG
jgi:hypothetical protein